MIALRIAVVAIARVVRPPPRTYGVSPTPTIAYLSRRYFSVLTSPVGIGISTSPRSADRRTAFQESDDQAIMESQSIVKRITRGGLRALRMASRFDSPMRG